MRAHDTQPLMLHILAVYAKTASNSMQLHATHILHYSNLRKLIITERLNVIYYTYHIYTK